MNLPDAVFESLLGRDEVATGQFSPPLVNIGAGEDLTIEALTRCICNAVGFTGRVEFDPTKPDGTLRKLMDSSRLARLGWRASTPMAGGLVKAYGDFLSQPGPDTRR